MSFLSKVWKNLLNPLGKAPKVQNITPQKAEAQDSEAIKNDAEAMAKRRRGRAATNLTQGQAQAAQQQSKSVLGF